MNASSSAAGSVPAPARSRAGRWFARLLALAVFTSALLVAAAPSIISWNPQLRDALVRRLLGDVNGDITIKSLSVGWLEPLKIDDVALRPLPGGSGPGTAGGESLVTIDGIESDRSLWGMLTSPEDIGTIRIERPVVFVKLTKTGSNFEEVFQPIIKAAAPMPDLLRFGVRARIIDGTLRGHSLENQEPWEITGINIGVGIRPGSVTPSGQAELIVEKGKLLDRSEISVGLCNDVFKYIAPVVADVAAAHGLVTLELDDWRLPWNDIGSGDLSGRLTMHTVEVGPGPMVQTAIRNVNAMPLFGQLYRNLDLPKLVQIANESTVNFRMIEGGKIHHEGLRFSVADVVDVQSHGSVGLDESLDMTAALGIHPPNPEQRVLALMRVLTAQDWPVHISGTLKTPNVDLSPLGDAWKQLVFQKLPQDWQSGRSSLGADVLNGVAERTGLPVDAGTVGPLLQMLGPLLQKATSPKTGPPPQAPTGQVPHQVAKPQTPAEPTPSNPMPPPSRHADGPRPRVLVDGEPPAVGPPPAHPPLSATPPAPIAAATPTAAPTPTGSSTAETIADGVGLAVDVLQAIRERRQAARQPQTGPAASPDAPPVPNAPNAAPPAPAAPPPRRPLLRGGLRLLRDVVDEATAPTPTPTATPSPTGK